MSGGRAPGKNVAWSKPQEPSFLKAFKAKVGYKEPVSVDTKREAMKPPSDDEREDREDELPAVVVLKSGDVGEDEYLDYRQKTKSKGDSVCDIDNSDTKDSEGGRIMFKKPTKRKSSEECVLDASTSKKTKLSDSSAQKNRQKKSNSKRVKNKTLLSFGEEEDDLT